MLSAGSGTTARAAESYYYQKDPLLGVESGNGHWVGQGAESLGLRGDVQQGDFSSVLRGQEPLTGNQLVTIKNGTSVEDRRAGNDYTFSVPKSVSIAFAVGVPMIKEAHDQAVEAVARHIEQHYSHGRIPGGAVNGSLVATRFDHSTSRALDPQLHTHLFIHNMTRTAIMFAAVADDGKGAKESFNALNVAMTRATHEAHIMTTSLEGLGVATEKAIEKTTTVHQADLLLESARSLSHAINCLEHGQQPLDSIGTNDEIRQAGELGNAIDRLQESLHQKQDQHEYQDQGMTDLHEHHQQQDHEPTLDANSM